MVSIVHAARDIARIREISVVLVRHGFGEIVQRLGLSRGKREREAVAGVSLIEPNAEEEERGERARAQMSSAVRARQVLEDLGPSFVKLGQIASTRPDLLPADIITELKKLQDSVLPVPFPRIKEQIERSLGTDADQLFEHIDETPLAAASIAQVHRARLLTDDGVEDVVIKVQRPGIAQKIAGDLDILHTLAALFERAIPESKIYSPVGLVQQFDRAISNELDFSAEAENAARFAQNFAGNPQLRFPRVFKQASSKHVLTLEYLDGLKVYDAIQSGHSGKRIARIALDAILRQIFEDGFFHADPHPGNVLICGTPDAPVLAMIDLGMVGRLSPRLRDLTIDVMTNAIRRDYDGIADALYAIGTPTRKIDLNAYRAEVALLSEKYLGKPLKDIELSAMIRDLVRGATKYGIEIPADFVMMGKALMTVEGVGKEIDPDLDAFEEAKPLFSELLRKRYSPERLGNELLRRIERLGGATSNLPEQVVEILDDLRLGRLRMQTEDPNLLASADRLGRRVFSALLLSSLVLAGAWLLASDHDVVGIALLSLAVVWLLMHATRDTIREFRIRR
jgi:ubiquinone biosynthesis protein